MYGGDHISTIRRVIHIPGTNHQRRKTNRDEQVRTEEIARLLLLLLKQWLSLKLCSNVIAETGDSHTVAQH